MPVLSNPKHERFAQELAKGKTQEEAYREAGYAGDRTAASRLSTNVNVQARLAELQERAAAKVDLTIADIIVELERARLVALGATTPQAGSAVAASMGKAKLLGLVVDKQVNASATLEELLDSLASPTEQPASADD